MITVNDILRFIETLAPRSMKMDWDNVGLLCGKRGQPVKKVLIALDPFESVCREAVACGADLIVTHHPLIFKAPHAITDDTSVGRSIMFLIQNNISAINAHTNLDCAPGGVNDCLAAKLSLEAVEVVAPSGTDDQGRPWGLLRKGFIPVQPLDQFLPFVKKQLGCAGLRFTNGGADVHCVAVGGGACAGELMAAVHAGCDTFVTADVKYNQFWDAQDLGINLIDAGHFHTENPVCACLADKLSEQFPDLTVVISQTHTDCTNFFV